MSMKNYVFVGHESVFGRIRMDRFGQKFSIDSDLADKAMVSLPILPEEEFNLIFPPGPVTAHQLKIWADKFISHFEIPSDKKDYEEKMDFLEKKSKAQARWAQIRSAETMPPAPPVTTETEEEGNVNG